MGFTLTQYVGAPEQLHTHLPGTLYKNRPASVQKRVCFYISIKDAVLFNRKNNYTIAVFQNFVQQQANHIPNLRQIPRSYQVAFRKAKPVRLSTNLLGS
ncbi:hypothetical protein [Desulfovibrio sp.]|uniref:hypothetical protein n=1 Tax=Desulfovibrio sp. TaxID=885 RepID=UPI0039E53A3C